MNRTIRPATATPDGPFRRYSSFAPNGSQRILREGILVQVFSESAPPIVMLQAPAGHGKSTVLQQIRNESAARGTRCAWLNLDDSDNDASRHATHLQRLLAQLSSNGGAPPDRSGDSVIATSSHQEPSDWFVEQLEADMTPLALFLDEFEILSDKSILQFWRDFLSKLPFHVRVYIATRALPDIGVPRLMVSNKLLVLHASELCFSLAEVHHFFASTGTASMESGDIETVHRCTEGWPAAIQLFRLGLLRRAPSDALRQIDQFRPRELADYLTECVLDSLSADTRLFLERTCVLNRLGGQVCNVLTGRSDSQQQLLRLEKFGLFISPLNEGHTWFRYHTLLATHLREQLLTLHHARFRSLHRQAAEWFYENGMYDDAMHHAVTSSDHVLSADILEQWTEQLVTDGEMSIAERWFECIPLGEVSRRPVLKRRMAWALLFLRQYAKVFALMGSDDPSHWYPDSTDPANLPAVAIATICCGDMAKAFDYVERVADTTVATDRFTAFELAAAANLDAFRLLIVGDFRQSEVRLATARAFNKAADAYFTVGYTDSVEGITLLLQGRVRDALDILCNSLISQRRALDAPFATAPLAACYVWALYVADDCRTAVRLLGDYREMVLKCAIPEFFAMGVISAARAYRALGQEAEARSILSEAEALCSLIRWSRVHWLVRRERLWGGSGSPSRSSPHTQDVASDTSSQWMPFADLLAESHLAPIRQAIRHKKYDDATAEISRLLEIHSESVYLTVQLGIIKAVVLDARGLAKPAARQFATALKLAHDCGYVRMVLDEGRTIRHLLTGFLASTQAAGESAIRVFAESVLNRINGRTPTTKVPPPGSVTLGSFSSREYEIIECLRLRMSNKEIADTTNISENTVKFHLKKIFGKLGIQRRSEAYAVVSNLRREPP